MDVQFDFPSLWTLFVVNYSFVFFLAKRLTFFLLLKSRIVERLAARFCS